MNIHLKNSRALENALKIKCFLCLMRTILATKPSHVLLRDAIQLSRLTSGISTVWETQDLEGTKGVYIYSFCKYFGVSII